MNTFTLLLLSAVAQPPPADYIDHDETCLLGNAIAQIIAPGQNEYEAVPYSDSNHVQTVPLTIHGVLIWRSSYRIVGSRTNTVQGYNAMLHDFALQYDRRKEYVTLNLGMVCEPIPPKVPWKITDFPDPNDPSRIAYAGDLDVEYMLYFPTP